MDKQVLYRPSLKTGGTGGRRVFFATGDFYSKRTTGADIDYLTPEDLPALKTIRDWDLTESSNQQHVTDLFVNHWWRYWDCTAPTWEIFWAALGLLRKYSGVPLKVFDGKTVDGVAVGRISTTNNDDEGLTGAQKDRVEAVSKVLIRFYDRVAGISTDVTDEIYAQFKDTGLYVKGSETVVAGRELRYSFPVTAALNVEYNQRRTATEGEHTKQEAERTDQHQEVAFQETFDTVRATDDALQEASADIEERYSTAIFYNRVLRYGALGLAVVVAVVVLVLTVRVMR